MIELKKEDLVCIDGGVNISGTLISALSKGVSTLLDMGRSLGTAIRRIGSNNLCSM